jgi:hypothetical protein
MRWRLLAAASVLGVVLSGCAKESDVKTHADSLNVWLTHLGNAVCQLEKRDPNQATLDQLKVQCPGGSGDTPKPPPYPPR